MTRIRKPCRIAMSLLGIAIFTAPLFSSNTPESVILIISDGTGVGQHTLSYYMNDRYAPAAFEHVGLMATNPIHRDKVTDSAAGATALATGQKTNRGALSVGSNNEPLKTVLEYAREGGLATGLVATSTITNATPAAFAVHVESRGEHDEIARQIAAAGVAVLFGGGRNHFLPKTGGGIQESDLFEEMNTRSVQVIKHLHEQVDHTRPVIGLFNDGSLPAAHRGREPSTTDMALRAVDILDDDPDGFFLMVEESQVDWGCHDHDMEYVKAEMASLNDLVDALLAYQTAHPQVLVLLVADHETGGLAMNETLVGSGYKAEWTTKGHTANLVPIFASGPGSEVFDAVVDNTFIGQTLIRYVTRR